MDLYSAAEDVQRLPSVVLDDQSLVLGIDIGGTKTAAGVVEADGHAHSFCVEPTPHDADADTLFAFVVALAERLRWLRGPCGGGRCRLWRADDLS